MKTKVLLRSIKCELLMGFKYNTSKKENIQRLFPCGSENLDLIDRKHSCLYKHYYSLP